MIFKGRKVLDGTLDEIQAQYGFDTVRVRTAAGATALAGLPGVRSVNDYGQVQEVRLAGDPQQFLQQLASRTPVHHFEITRPSLHDIFVRIAKPAEVYEGHGSRHEATK
jgi:ABC-2 type transport system ATP-binding protein